MNEIYNNFITYYKPIDENVTFNEKTGHINFQIKNRNEYEQLINSMKNMSISNNSKNKINNPPKSNIVNNKNYVNRPSTKTNQNVQFNAINTYKNNNLQNSIHYGLVNNNNLINMNNRNNINNNNQNNIYNSIQFKYNNYTPNNISINNIYNNNIFNQNNIYNNNIYNPNNIYNNNTFNQNYIYNSNIYNRNNINNQNSKYNINSSYNLNNQYNINNNVNNNTTKNKFKNKKTIINKNSQEVNKIKYIFEYFDEIVKEPDIYLPLKHNYTIELTDKISLSKNEERFLLYVKYERAVHNENPSIQVYNLNWGLSILERKLINIPGNLHLKTRHPELYPKYYGTYNLIHRIDGKIVAVTVWDILPNYLESVYCYYDPEYSFLDLGVITVIREIEYMKSFQKLIDKNFIFYSLGEMCQSCQKLKYKGNYFPTEIMDPYTGKYVLLNDDVKKLIADNKCHHFTNPMNSGLNYFSNYEIEYIFQNLIISVENLGKKFLLKEFLNLYIVDEKYRKILIEKIRRFLQIIDKESFSKIEFYFDPSGLPSGMF